MKTQVNLPPTILLAIIAARLAFPPSPAAAQSDRYQGEIIPPEAVTELQEARKLRRAGQYDLAIRRLRTLAEQQPSYYLAWYNLGLAQAAADDPELAAEAFQRALTLKEDLNIPDSSIYNTVGWNNYLRGDYLSAKPLLEKAVAQEDLSQISRQKALNNLGSVLLRLQEYEEAEKYFKEAADTGSSRAEINLKVLSAVRSVKEQQENAPKREKDSGGG